MSFFNQFIDTSHLKELVFGENNSRLDFLLDYFFNIRQEKRSRIIFWSIIGLVVFIVSLIFFYFTSLYSLQKSLNTAVIQVQQLNNLKPSYMDTNTEFEKLSNEMEKNNKYETLVNSLTQKHKELDLENPSLPDRPITMDLPNTDPFYGHFQKIRIEYNLPHISLKKMIDYMNAIHQMKNHLQIVTFEIQQRFGTKLYFDVSVALEAYIPPSSQTPR